MSVLDEDMDATMESSKLPVLQALLERMEGQAGRVVANELAALARGESSRGEEDYGALDDVGRERLKQLSRQFHETCAKVSRLDELLALQWRVQSMEEKRFVPPEEVCQRTSETVVGLAPGASDAEERPSSEPVVGLAPEASDAEERPSAGTGERGS